MNSPKTVGQNDKCPCCSGKTWGQCCGSMLSTKADVKVFTAKKAGLGEPTHFIVLDLVTKEPIPEPDGTVVIYTSQAQAIGSRREVTAPIAVMGMPTNRLHLFLADYPKYRIAASNAA